MKRQIPILLLLLMLVGLTVAACASTPGASPTPGVVPTLKPLRSGNRVIAQGKVVPAQSAALSLPTGGIVAEVLVKEGDKVQPNQVLLRLSNKQQTAAVAAADANVKRAQARVNELKAGPRPQEIAVAEAGVAIAQAQLAKLTAGADENQLIEARAAVANAEAAVNLARAAFDRVGGASNPDVAMLPTSLALAQAQNNLVAAKARLAALAAPARAEDIVAAQAEIKRAQAQVDLAKLGVRPETIATAEADVQAAQADLQRAQAALADTELRAPFAGTVATPDIKVGEQGLPGTPIVRLADFSAWQIETTDLTEISIVQVKEGETVSIRFDSINDLELPGKVVRIRSLGENRQGDIVFTVIVKPDRQEDRLRWNMTAQVTIQAQ